MLSKSVMGWGAIFVAVAMALTVLMGWPSSVHYLWAVIVLAWGVMWLKG